MIGSGPTQWAWIERYAQQFAACDVRSGDLAAVLFETTSQPSVVVTARLALEHLGAEVVELGVPSSPSAVALPTHKTGVALALDQNSSALAGLRAADFIADCTIDGLSHSPSLGSILSEGTKVLSIANEHPENVERWLFDPDVQQRIDGVVDALRAASVLEITSDAGTDLTVDLDGADVTGAYGWTADPGTVAQWPGGLVDVVAGAGKTSGRIVLAPGDVNLTFKQYVQQPVSLTVGHDHITTIDGPGADAALVRSFLAAFGEPEAYRISHLGWGMNPVARRESMLMWDKADTCGAELRASAGSVGVSTGVRRPDGHRVSRFEGLLAGASVAVDGDEVVRNGVVRPDLMA